MKLDVLRRWQFEPLRRTYTERDTMLYALGIGLGAHPTNPDELRFVTEKNLSTLPTFGVVAAKLEIRKCLLAAEVDVVEAFHGEQRTTFDRPLPPSGTVVDRGRIIGIWDKGKGRGTLVEFQQELFDAETGVRYCDLRNLTFLRRDGGFGGDATEPPRAHALPDEAPHAISDFPTIPQASLIYRLSGDMNPLHSDPEIAKQAGLPRPILHGYCSYGIAAWSIMKTWLDCHPARLASLDCRFSGPAFPGETLRTEMWRHGDVISYRVRALPRDVVVIGNGRATVRP